MENLWFWLESFEVSRVIRESQWVFPMIEALHVVTLAITVGSIALLDLRLLGWGLKDRSIVATARDALPWTWTAFFATVVSGFFMFASAASYYVIIPAFRYKVLFLVLAGANMLVLHFTAWREVADWSEAPRAPAGVRAAAVLSLVFWSLAVTFGRWTGFF